MKVSRLVTAALGLALGACSVGPEYQRPTIAVPAHWSQTQAGPPVARSSDGWQQLHDQELNRLLAIAVKNNLDLAQATTHIRAARAARRILAAAQSPSLDFSSSASREHESANVPATAVGVPGETDSLFQSGFDASWELDLFGARRRRLQAADAQIQALQYDRADVLLSVLAEVSRNYLLLRSCQEQQALADERLRLRQDQLALIESLARAGMSSDDEVASAAADLSNAQAARPPLLLNARRYMHQLEILLAKNPGELDDELSRNAAPPQLPPSLPSSLPSDLLRQRPDIRAAERRLAAASARIGAAQADWYPQFSLLAGIGWASSTLGSLATGASRAWSIGPALTWPILRGGQIAATIKVRNAEQQAALIDYRRTLLQALADTENALAAYTQEQSRLRSLNQAMAAQQRRLTQARSRYAAGLDSYRQVQIRHSLLLDAQGQEEQSEQALRTDWVALHKALGGGWDSKMTHLCSPKPAAGLAAC